MLRIKTHLSAKYRIQNRYVRRLVRALIVYAFPIVICLSVSSCSREKDNDKGDARYEKVIDSVNHLIEHHKDKMAIHYIDSLTPKYNDLSLVQKLRYFAIKYNYHFHVKNDNDMAMIYADSILDLFSTSGEKLKHLPHYDQGYFLKGDVLFSEGKYSEAYQYFYKGKLIADKNVSDCTLSDFSYRMGMIMYRQENFRLAGTNFINSIRETGNCDLTFGNFYRIQELTNNAGLCYSKLKEYDRALFYYHNALAYIDRNGPRFGKFNQQLDVARGVIYGNEAKIYTQQNNFTAAKILLKQSAAINLRKGNDNHDAGLSEIKLARIYLQENHFDSLKSILIVLRGQLDMIKDRDATADWNYLNAQYFIKHGDQKSGLAYLKKYSALKDSATEADKKLREADIAQQIKQLEKNNEFENLKQDNRQQHLYLKTGSAFGFLALIILLLIVRNWQRSRANIKTLGTLNRQINDQHHSLETALHDLELSSREKDRILRTVAHDLRNPVGGIASLSAVIAEGDHTEQQKEMIGLIRDTSGNTLELINEILDVTDAGAAVVSPEMIGINTLVRNSVDLLRFKAAEKGQVIKLELLNTETELLINREKIWRVIGNLISNAIKFSPPNETIAVKVINAGSDVEILVKDRGIGIPENLKDKVFNMFTEAKRPGTLGEKSFGLGLSISKQIVESYGGKIWFENNKNKGTTFFIRLPKP